jgi:KaiC/GvpD/RAD55 family RecA-like ATPase
MGLLHKAEKRRAKLLEKLTKDGKKYIEHISLQKKKTIKEHIKKQRKEILKIVPLQENKKPEKRKLVKKNIIKKGKTKKKSTVNKNSIVEEKLSLKEKPPKINFASIKEAIKKKLSGKRKQVIEPQLELQKEAQEAQEGKVDELNKSNKLDLKAIKSEIQSSLKLAGRTNQLSKTKKDINRIATGVPGFDDLFEKGIPKGNSIIVAGGAGSGKTIFCLQTLFNHVSQGKKCFYMSFEESEERLVKHMEEFGWDVRKYLKKGTLKIKRISPFEITRNVDAMLAKEKGELLIKVDPVILPKGFKPDFIALDSLTAIASAFTGKEDSYRIYIEQLFRFFERLEATAFLITETKQIPEIFSTTGVEEFLADGVIVIYNIKRGDVRESAIEVLKMRGEKHQKKIVAMQISDNGITVYPDQEIFGGLDND